MNNELTNLLPIERQRGLLHEYFLRLGVVIAVLITILTGVAALLLIPTYVFLLQSASAKMAHLASIESVLSSADEKVLSARLAVLSNDAAILIALGEARSPSALIRTLLSVPRPGVTLSSFVYTPALGEAPGTLTLFGVATTRDALRAYQLAVQGAPFTATADLPVSAYAKDTDITFSIAVTLKP